MHLLYDARLLHRQLSGLERVQRNMVRELAAHPAITRLRVAVQVGTEMPAGLPAEVEVVEAADTSDLLRVLLHPSEREQPDVYHLTWFSDQAWDLLLPLAAKASVVEVHDAILNRHPEYHPDREAWRWYHEFVRQLLANSHRILVHSRSVAGEVVHDLGGNAELIDVAPEGVDPELRRPLTERQVKRALAPLLRRAGILEGEPYFMALGKDYPHKDHATMYRALARLPAPHRERTHIVCVGEAVWSGAGETTQMLLQRLGIANRVTFLDHLSDAQVKALLQGSKGLVYPSLEEGFGLPPIEAMALGVPVAAAASMSIPEVCGDGALLFEPGNDEELARLMEILLEGGERVAAVIARGRERERLYSWKRCADDTVASYVKAVEAARGSGRGLQGAALRSVAIAARSRVSVARELLAWKERCLHAEAHLADVEADRDELRRRLEEPPRGAGGAAAPPAAVAKAAARASRWRQAVWRRLRGFS